MVQSPGVSVRSDSYLTRARCTQPNSAIILASLIQANRISMFFGVSSIIFLLTALALVASPRLFLCAGLLPDGRSGQTRGTLSFLLLQTGSQLEPRTR